MIVFLKRRSATRKTADVIATASSTVPAIASRFAVRSIASLSRSRQRIRWYEVGAMKRIEPIAVATSATR